MSAPRFLANNSSRLHLRGGLRTNSSRTHSARYLRINRADPRLSGDSHQLQRPHLGAHQTRP